MIGLLKRRFSSNFSSGRDFLRRKVMDFVNPNAYGFFSATYQYPFTPKQFMISYAYPQQLRSLPFEFLPPSFFGSSNNSTFYMYPPAHFVEFPIAKIPTYSFDAFQFLPEHMVEALPIMSSIPLHVNDSGTKTNVDDHEHKLKSNSSVKSMCAGNSSYRKNGTKLKWVPKMTHSSEKSKETSSVTEISTDTEMDQSVSESLPYEEGKTTVMIRNIPNKFTRQMLLNLLDKFCMEENGDECEFSCAFDFVYLPMDFTSGCNLGYAFVNFTDADAAWKFHCSLHKYKWRIMGSKKICEISYARIQGRDALEKHFQNSIFTCEDDEYLPVTFFPRRNGKCTGLSCTVGKRVSLSD